VSRFTGQTLILPSSLERAAEFGWPSGDQPGELGFTSEVPKDVARAILSALSGDVDDRLYALHPVTSPIGRYAWLSADAPKFVRVSAKWGAPELEQSITRLLHDRGVAVNHLERAGAPVIWEGTRLRADVRPLLRGVHFNGSDAQLGATAMALARCHAVLREFAHAARVRDNTVQRFTVLEKVQDDARQALLERNWHFFGPYPEWAERESCWLEQMVREFQPRFDLMAGAQCLHAQVHRGNVIFRADDDTPVFLDFEESVYTFAPVAWDLAYFIQRFALYDDPSPELLARRLECIRVNYGALGAGVAAMMRQTAWLSVAILARDWNAQQLRVPLAEYEKFVRLEKQARELEAVL
jgi:hypothetical protein